MPANFLYQDLNSAIQLGFLKIETPDWLKENLNPKFELRPYQGEAFARFFHCLDNNFPGKERPLHLLFNMATGSGKTLIMAGLILYLYEKAIATSSSSSIPPTSSKRRRTTFSIPSHPNTSSTTPSILAGIKSP